MGEEHPSSQEDVWLVSRHTLEPLQQRLIDSTRPELVYELVVVDRLLFPVGGDGALDVPGSDDLRVRAGMAGGLDGGRAVARWNCCCWSRSRWCVCAGPRKCGW